MSRRHSCRSAASRASRVWAASLVAVLAAHSTTTADVIHLKDGRVLQARSCREEGQELRCAKAGGTIGIPLDQVARIERGGGAADARRRLSTDAPSGTPAALPPLIESHAQAGHEMTPALAKERIAQLKSTGGPRQEMASLYAYLGNNEMLLRNYDGAVQLYHDALENDPGLTVARLNLCTALINLNRQGDAEEIARDVLSGQPDNPRAMELLGEAALQTGRIDEAIGLWEKSLALKPSDGLQARLERARRLGRAEAGFRGSEGARFSIRFDGEAASPELVGEIQAYLDESFSILASRFSHYPSGVIRVTLYSKQAFQEATASPDWVGGLFDGQLRVPVGGLPRLTPGARRVLIHELTHCFISSITRGNAPRWIQEGIAQVVEGRSSAASRAAIRQANEALGGAGTAASFSYPQALSQVEYFLKTWSESHFNDLLDHLGHGTDIDASLRDVTGLSLEEFMKSWGESL